MQREVWQAPQEMMLYGNSRAKQAKQVMTLMHALLLDWETMPLTPAPPIPTIGEPYPPFAHATLQDLDTREKKT